MRIIYSSQIKMVLLRSSFLIPNRMMFPIRVYAVYFFLVRSRGSIAEQSSIVVVHATQNPL